MECNNVLVWNVRGLNGRAHRDAVHMLVDQETVSLLCLQEIKLDTVDDTLISTMLGTAFDYSYLPAVHTCGGILVAWRRDTWSLANVELAKYSITAQVTTTSTARSWWLTVVYGPHLDRDKPEFLQELKDIRQARQGRWLVYGDFNMYYQAADKNNLVLN